MKNKTLTILLIIPFIVGLLTFVSVEILNNTVASDINDISWNFKQDEAYKVNSLIELKAKAVYDEDLLIAPKSDELVWKIKNMDDSTSEYASLVYENDKTYLKANDVGDVKVVCENKRGTKAKYFIAHIYRDGYIVCNRLNNTNSSSVYEGNKYFIGQYDMTYSDLKLDEMEEKAAKFNLDAHVKDSETKVYFEAKTPNIKVNGNEITCLNSGHAIVNLYTTERPFLARDFEFDIVENGYNIYSYNDLLMATNFSSKAKNVVMQVNLESLKNLYRSEKMETSPSKIEEYKYFDERLKGTDSTELFGNFNFDTQKFNFENEYKKVTSTYNTKFIDQCNQTFEKKLDNQIIAAIDLKGDLYGNGYKINANDLAFTNHGVFENGKIKPTDADYFHGPLPFFFIGNQDLNLVKSFGQDNCTLFINGDNLTIDDITIRNTNELNNTYLYTYSGSVVDNNGKNNTIKNSVLSHGRTIVRAFDSDGLLIDNCILQNAGEFILKVGSNSYNSYDFNKSASTNFQNKEYDVPFPNFFDVKEENSPINEIYNELLDLMPCEKIGELEDVMTTLNDIQDSLDNLKGITFKDRVIYKDKIFVKNCSFYNSGIFSIALESSFNGPFLLNGACKKLESLIGGLLSGTIPKQIGGTSYPVLVDVDSKTKFYDWKNINKIDANILIEENISQSYPDFFLNLDEIFPVKSELLEQCKKVDSIYYEDEKPYINSKVAYYGGGLNLSEVKFEPENETLDLSEPLMVNIAQDVYEGKYVSQNGIAHTLAKCIVSAIGSHPFKFIVNDKINNRFIDIYESPKIEHLKDNLR